MYSPPDVAEAVAPLRLAGANGAPTTPRSGHQFSEEDLPQIGVVDHAPHHFAENRDAAVCQARLDLLLRERSTGAATARAARSPAAIAPTVAAVVVATPPDRLRVTSAVRAGLAPSSRTPLARRRAALRTGGGDSPAAFRPWGGRLGVGVAGALLRLEARGVSRSCPPPCAGPLSLPSSLLTCSGNAMRGIRGM